MQSIFSRKLSNSGLNFCGLLLSFGLPVVLLLAFLAKQYINVDSIGWSNGFAHPLTGWDHLVTMLAVGVWAAQLRGQAIWMLPLAFVSVMSLGGLVGAAGLAIPSVEGIILLSCAVFSLLITRKVRFNSKINVLIVAFFAFFHGFAHGQEISTSASLISYTLGFMLATLLLHGAGILAAKLVVLLLSCLLTALFSNFALAKTFESDIVSKHENTASSGFTGFSKLTQFRIVTEPPGYKTGYAVFDEDNPCAEMFSRDRGGGQYTPASKIICPLADDIARTPPKICCDAVIADGTHYGVLLKHAPFKSLNNWLGMCFFEPGYLSDGGLNFKHYFPDINHTPGTHLLSNGVGLTSPPILFIPVLAPQNPSKFCKTPFSFFEDNHLQSGFAKFFTCNSEAKNFSDSRHGYAVRRLPYALLCNAELSFRNCNCLSCLTPDIKAAHSSSVAAEVLSAFYALYSGNKSLCISNVITISAQAKAIQVNQVSLYSRAFNFNPIIGAKGELK